MADLNLIVTVSRAYLGLPDLDINDHISYSVAPSFLGAQVSWNRQQVGSAFLDGKVTVSRQREMVSEPIVVECPATDPVHLAANITALLDAFRQSTYYLSVNVNGAAYQYECEAADYQVAWNGPRFLATRGQVTLNVPRQPMALVGGY